MRSGGVGERVGEGKVREGRQTIWIFIDWRAKCMNTPFQWLPRPSSLPSSCSPSLVLYASRLRGYLPLWARVGVGHVPATARSVDDPVAFLRTMGIPCRYLVDAVYFL